MKHKLKLTFLAIVLIACQSGETPSTTLSPTTPFVTTTTAPEGLITSVEDLPMATIQIVSTGTFVTPDFGIFEGGGSGSGFIIDPSGVAVTNSHVVSGAGLLDVHIGGSAETVNAQSLGVSECNDLAVIDLAGDGYSYLEWYDGDIFAGLEVQAAGYPLGEPEFALTQGIISKADAPGETEWASIDAILEHDARIRGGNSGGPLVTEGMTVVGINYAGRDDTDQSYAISVREAERVVEALRSGTDVDSVGINGYAVTADDGTQGVWVETVQAGSSADRAGVTGGDIVTRMAGVSLALEGTMEEFCDVIRTQGEEGVIEIEVLRYDTAQVLRGQLNGNALTEAFSFAEELDEEATVDEGTSVYADYVVISDDTGAITVEVPLEWADVDGRPYEDDQGRSITDVQASSNLDSFLGSWSTPGMIVSASSDWATSTTEEALLDDIQANFSDICEYVGREVYEDPLYMGSYDTFVNCGDEAATYVVVAAHPVEANYLVRVQVQANSDRDFEALDRILASFIVTGDV